MKKLLLLLLLWSNILFSQENISCDDVLDIFDELVTHHENLVIQYCTKLEEKSNRDPNISIEKIIMNTSEFTGNYLNYFINNKESIRLKRKLSKNEKQILICIKDEQVRYDVNARFTDIKTNIKEQVSPKFEKGIDKMFEIILKKIKLK